MRADRSHWGYAAVLLFIGAKMVVDPDSFIALGENVGMGLAISDTVAERACPRPDDPARLRRH